MHTYLLLHAAAACRGVFEMISVCIQAWAHLWTNLCAHQAPRMRLDVLLREQVEEVDGWWCWG